MLYCTELIQMVSHHRCGEDGFHLEHNTLTNTTPFIPEYDQDRYPVKSYTLMIMYITHRFCLY